MLKKISKIKTFILDRVIKSRKEKLEYEDFTPNKNIDKSNEYLRALEWGIKNNDVLNIALAGPYGAGKSSVIQSFIKNHPKIKVINISLASFFELKEEKKEVKSVSEFTESGDETDYKLVEFSEEKIEEGILKQLFYKVAARRIPQSRYRKLHRIKLLPYIGKVVFISIIGTLFACFLIGDKTEELLNVAKSKGSYWSIGENVTLAILLISWLLGVMILSYVLWWITSKFKIKEVKIADKATVSEEKDNNESIFNKNMDEIVYFFEATNFDTVFIEDLDRFDSTEIFIKLRELNTILNNNEMIKRKRITFVYAVRDDIFVKNDRTKFFDFIIPIIPVINSTNSGEILRKKLDVKEQRNGIIKSTKHDISAKYITLISPYIEDMRVLTSICNEFIVYKKIIKDNQKLELKDEHMFSLMVFKNLFVKEFSNLSAEKGIIKDAFIYKRKFVDEKINLLQKENNDLKEILDNVEKDVLHDIREVKIALLHYLSDDNGMVNHVITEEGYRYFPEIMKDDFDLSTLKRKNIKVSYLIPSESSHSKVFKNLEQELKDNGRNYFKRYEYLKNNIENRKEEIKSKIEENEKEIQVMRSFSLSTLLKKYSIEDVLSQKVCNNKLLVFLLRNGYLDENYSNYINYFHSNSISKDEMNFILGVRDFVAVGDFNYAIKNCAHLIERIEDYEFKQVEVLNFDLMDYFITNNSYNYIKYQNFMKQLSNRTEISKAFIKAYIERGTNIEKFLSEIIKYDLTLWIDLEKDKAVSEDTKYKYMKMILEYCNLVDIKTINMSDNERVISAFFETRKDILKHLSEIKISRMKEIISELEIHFSELSTDGIENELLEYIYTNSHYELNHSMIRNIFKLKAPERIDNLVECNYTEIRLLAYEPLMKYVIANFSQYIQFFVLNQPENVKEDLSAVQDILDRMFKNNMTMCLEVIDKERVIWDSLDECFDKVNFMDITSKGIIANIWNRILKLDKVKPNWKSYIAYHNQYNLTSDLLSFVNRHMKEMVSSEDAYLLTDDLQEELICADLNLEAFKLFIRRFKVYEIQLKDFNNDKINMMIFYRYFTFNPERVTEMKEAAPYLYKEFIILNKVLFFNLLSEFQLNKEEIGELISDRRLTDDEKIRLIELIDSSDIDKTMADIIRNTRIEVSREYVEAAWTLVEEEQKYQLLLYHMEVYSLDELEAKFRELGGVYTPLAERTKRHKVTLVNNEFNKELMDYLVKINYLTSVNIETTGTEDIITKQKNNESHIIGRVKQK